MKNLKKIGLNLEMDKERKDVRKEKCGDALTGTSEPR